MCLRVFTCVYVYVCVERKYMCLFLPVCTCIHVFVVRACVNVFVYCVSLVFSGVCVMYLCVRVRCLSAVYMICACV